MRGSEQVGDSQQKAQRRAQNALQGQLYQIKGNEPILLNEPNRVLVVQSGSLPLIW